MIFKRGLLQLVNTARAASQMFTCTNKLGQFKRKAQICALSTLGRTGAAPKKDLRHVVRLALSHDFHHRSVGKPAEACVKSSSCRNPTKQQENAALLVH